MYFYFLFLILVVLNVFKDENEVVNRSSSATNADRAMIETLQV